MDVLKSLELNLSRDEIPKRKLSEKIERKNSEKALSESSCGANSIGKAMCRFCYERVIIEEPENEHGN